MLVTKINATVDAKRPGTVRLSWGSKGLPHSVVIQYQRSATGEADSWGTSWSGPEMYPHFYPSSSLSRFVALWRDRTSPATSLNLEPGFYYRFRITPARALWRKNKAGSSDFAFGRTHPSSAVSEAIFV